MRHKVIAKVLLVNESGEILSLTRSKNDAARPGEWDFPGGNLNEDEGHRPAIIREAAEETGIVIEDPLFVYATTDAYGEDLVLTFMFFVAHVTGRPEVNLSEEHESFEWASIDALREKPTFAPFSEALDFITQHNPLA
jgi:8-oxo-dGTP diphosphatase